MLRVHYLRVAVVALILFGPPALLGLAMDDLRTRIEADSGLLRAAIYLAGLLVATALRLLGPVVFAGYLDEAVGKEYYHGGRTVFSDVLGTLPWGRLVAADIVVVVGSAIGLAFFVVPGLIFLTLFSLVGPVIVQEGRGVVASFERTFRLSRAAWRMTASLVVSLLVAELVVHEAFHIAFHDSELLLRLIAGWLTAAIVGGLIGLVEVALATELMARTPLREAPDPE